MSFQEKELDILRDAVDKNEKLRGKKKINDPKIKKIIEIVEGFLVKKKKNLLWWHSNK